MNATEIPPDPSKRQVIVRDGARRSRYNPLSFIGIVVGTLGIISLTFWINCLYNLFHVHDSNPRVNFEAFVNAVAYIAHRESHHPEITFGYNNCRIELITHAISGLSENDFISAAKIDALLD